MGGEREEKPTAGKREEKGDTHRGEEELSVPPDLVAGAFKAINGGEGFCDIRERVLRQRDAMLQQIPLGSAGVIVSHMWVTRAMVGEAIGEANPLKVDIPTASISIIDYKDGFSAAAFSAGECSPPTVHMIGFKPES